MIESHPNAPEGLVLHPADYTPSLFVPPCAILCRNTAPLVAFAYSLLQRDVPCRVLGRDIGAMLVGIVKKCRARDIAHLTDQLLVWKHAELQRCDALGTSPERIYDQYDCLMFFLEDLEVGAGVPDLVAKIELLFEEPKDASRVSHVLLSTIHKAKGLEWPHVFLLDFTRYLPSKYATQPWQRRQESNLAYVAITRSQHTLVYINSNNWKTTV